MATPTGELLGQQITIDCDEQIGDFYTGLLEVDLSTEYDLTKGIDITFDGQLYKNVSVAPIPNTGIQGFVLGEFDLNLNPVLNKYPFFIVLRSNDNTITSFNNLIFYAKTEGEHTFTISKASGSKRVMTLFGASRTYSHTAEPRNVKFAGGVKDWPIKKETTILVDGFFDCGADDSVMLAEWSGTSEDFVNQALSVTIDGTEAEKTEWGFQIEGFADIFYDAGYIQLYAYDAGRFLIKIITDTVEVAEDFKEAVEMVSSGAGDPFMPPLPDPETYLLKNPAIELLDDHGENPRYEWVESLGGLPRQQYAADETFIPIKEGSTQYWREVGLTYTFSSDTTKEAKFILKGYSSPNGAPTNLQLHRDTSPDISEVFDGGNGTYVLKAIVNNDTITTEWVKEN